MYICVYIYMHTHTHTHTHTHIHLYTYIYICTHIYTYIYICVCVCIYRREPFHNRTQHLQLKHVIRLTKPTYVGGGLFTTVRSIFTQRFSSSFSVGSRKEHLKHGEDERNGGEGGGHAVGGWTSAIVLSPRLSPRFSLQQSRLASEQLQVRPQRVFSACLSPCVSHALE